MNVTIYSNRLLTKSDVSDINLALTLSNEIDLGMEVTVDIYTTTTKIVYKLFGGVILDWVIPTSQNHEQQESLKTALIKAIKYRLEIGIRICRANKNEEGVQWLKKKLDKITNLD